MRKGDVKITDVQIKALCQNISLGMPKKWAVINASVPESSFYNYIEEGTAVAQKLEQNPDAKTTKRDRKVLELLESVKKAESNHIKRNLMVITAASKKTWTAAAWQLERRWPKDFGLNSMLRVQGDLNIVKFDIKYSQEEEAAFLERFKDFFDFDKKIKKDGEEYDK